MVRSATGTPRTSGFTLTLLIVTAVIPLAGVALANLMFDEVSQASPFGQLGTLVAVFVIMVVAIVGTVVAWRGADGAARGITATGLFCAAGITTVLSVFFLVAGGIAIGFACALFPATVSFAMIGQAVLRSRSSGRQGRA